MNITEEQDSAKRVVLKKSTNSCDTRLEIVDIFENCVNASTKPYVRLE